jgi:hypothetical protein
VYTVEENACNQMIIEFPAATTMKLIQRTYYR